MAAHQLSALTLLSSQIGGEPAGAEDIRKRLRWGIQQQRLQRNMTPKALQEASGIIESVEDIEQGKIPLTGDTLNALSVALELSLDDLLPIRGLSKEDEAEWVEFMERDHGSPVLAAGGDDQSFEMRDLLHFFIRLKAIDELSI